ncbi:MAG TPA: transposase, partial [Chryseobacterium sp.]|nr:transposase [Chryseobacterium sp.]
MDIKEKKIKKTTPDYKQIYQDLITMKYPEKLQQCEHILRKKELGFLDVL